LKLYKTPAPDLNAQRGQQRIGCIHLASVILLDQPLHGDLIKQPTPSQGLCGQHIAQ